MNLSGSIHGGLDPVLALLHQLADPKALIAGIEQLKEQESKTLTVISKARAALAADRAVLVSDQAAFTERERTLKAKINDADSRASALAQAEQIFYKAKSAFEIYEAEARAELSVTTEALRLERAAFEAEAVRKTSEAVARAAELENALREVAVREANLEAQLQITEDRRVELEVKIAKLKEITG